jgi:hypothetical protein
MMDETMVYYRVFDSRLQDVAAEGQVIFTLYLYQKIRKREYNIKAEFARFFMHVIKRFPFVRGVFVSGELSKNVSPPKQNIFPQFGPPLEGKYPYEILDGNIDNDLEGSLFAAIGKRAVTYVAFTVISRRVCSKTTWSHNSPGSVARPTHAPPPLQLRFPPDSLSQRALPARVCWQA